MMPLYVERGERYGLKKALAWFRDQDMYRWTREVLACRREEVLTYSINCLGLSKNVILCKIVWQIVL